MIRPIIERVRRMGISCAEVGEHEILNGSTIGVTLVSGSTSVIEAELRKVLDLCHEICPGHVRVLSEDRIRP